MCNVANFLVPHRSLEGASSHPASHPNAHDCRMRWWPTPHNLAESRRLRAMESPIAEIRMWSGQPTPIRARQADHTDPWSTGGRVRRLRKSARPAQLPPINQLGPHAYGLVRILRCGNPRPALSNGITEKIRYSVRDAGAPRRACDRHRTTARNRSVTGVGAAYKLPPRLPEPGGVPVTTHRSLCSPVARQPRRTHALASDRAQGGTNGENNDT